MTLVSDSGQPLYKVLIAVPCGELVHARFAQDLALMMAYTTHVRPEMEVHLAMVQGTYLPRARAALVAHAVERMATHVLWLDADMRFPKDTLFRLLRHEKPVVAANYPTRQAPILPTAVLEGGEYVFDHGSDLVEAKHAGMGCMLTEVRVFLALTKPYFAIGYAPKADEYGGEDVYFCDKARANGFAIWVDGALSEEIKHLGGFAFEMGHARMTRDAALAQQENP